MKTPSTINWLHLSDFHIGNPKYGWDSSRRFRSLFKDLEWFRDEAEIRPDMIFITGDLAYGMVDDKFPIKKGDKITVFVALSSSADYLSNVTTEINLSIIDENGNEIFNDSINGEEISWQIVGYETTFKADKSYNKLTLISEISDDAGNVDFVDLVYEAENEPKGIGLILVIIILIMLITLIAYVYLKNTHK